MVVKIVRMGPILLIDSGIGGLPYLSWIQENLAEENLVYVADRLNFPYGEKSPEEVSEKVVRLGRSLLKSFDPKLLIVACNTASVYALNALRQELPIPVVGVVPAVKSAAAVTRNRRIGILATDLTVRSLYLADLIRDFAGSCQVFSLSAGDIVRYVEEDFFHPQHEERRQMLGLWSRRLRELNVDTVVLGCTHFLHVIPELRELLGDSVTLVDSQSGVGRRAKQLLEEKGLRNREGKGEGVFYVHWQKDSDLDPMEVKKYQLFAQRFHLRYGGYYIDG